LALPSAEVVQRNVVPWIGIALREQFGRVLVEAMACGVPVVGSEVGEIPHVIGPAGLTFPAGDVPALVERLARLRDDPGLRRRLAVEATTRARSEFGWDRAADRMTEVWRSLTAASSRSSSDSSASARPASSSSSRQKAGKVTTS
jgi:glycosyltransferase involved in cell wall biosynthesis